MKQAVNFRLSHQAIIALSMLEKSLHTSKTAIIEQALRLYAKKKLTYQKTILQYYHIFQ